MKLCTVCNGHFEDKLEACPNESYPLIYIGKQPLIGIIIGGRYKVIKAVGAGSMGVVYKAIQISSGREMAVKVLTSAEGPDSAHLRRFRREARAVSSLSHENIVRLYDFGFMEDGQPYIVTEFVKGRTLAQILRERGRLPLSDVLPIARQVCHAVDEAHRVGVVHRDLKPENIILQEPEQRPGAPQKVGLANKLVKVVDFGVAKIASDASSSASLTMEGKVCGSPGYMSPEQCKGFNVDVTSDIYSLGIILFEVISGHRPFSADSVMGLLFMHVNEQPPLMNALCLDLNVPSEVEQVVRKALQKESYDRQQSALELWKEFESACHGRGTAKVPVVQAASGNNSNWIPFIGKENRIIIEHAQRYAHHRPARALDSLDPEEFYLPEEDDEADAKSNAWWFTTPAKLGLLIGTIVLVAMTVLGMVPSVVKVHDIATDVPDSLIAKGKPAEAMEALDRLKKQRKNQFEDTEPINSRYIDVANGFIQKKNYSAALEALQRVPNKSKYYAQANQLMNRYRNKMPTD
jgi:serine/threonine-protein kinase